MINDMFGMHDILAVISLPADIHVFFFIYFLFTVIISALADELNWVW